MRHALISVSDKRGLEALARGLVDLGFVLLSTGGTARALRDAGLNVKGVSEHTSFPEILGGRVKTLHPKVHAGILARPIEAHRATLGEHGIPEIDVVVVNLYPFARAAADPKGTRSNVIEQIDIGGPTLIRASAKNHERVTIVVDPDDYGPMLDALKAAKGGVPPASVRRRLAQKAFAHTAAYDAFIAQFLGSLDEAEEGDAFPEDIHERLSRTLGLVLPRTATLRYGENPHQRAAIYLRPDGHGVSVAHAHQLQGKALSYNNYLDLDSALRGSRAFRGTGRAVVWAVKHLNPCGVGLADDLPTAFSRARSADPVSIFGGVIGVNRPVDAPTAELFRELFLEAIIAPAFAPEARDVLRRKKALRLLETGDDGETPVRSELLVRSVSGGLLVQSSDEEADDVQRATVPTKRAPTEEEWRALDVAWRIVRQVKSNAIVYADAAGSVGIGAGQMSRVEAARLGADLAKLPLQGTAVGSDAFFPFRDGLDVCVDAGATAVAQPGGSKRDPEVIAAADERGIAMVLVGRRHFRH